jgi:hypothetical protein
MQKEGYRRRRSLAPALLLLGLAGCGADTSDLTSRASTNFEASRFCRQYACRASGERELQEGGLSRAYRVRGPDSILIELQSWRAGLFSASIGLYGPKEPRSDFRALATEFFASALGDCHAARLALHYDLARPLSDLIEARPRRCGPWEVRAGQVGTDYIIRAER